MSYRLLTPRTVLTIENGVKTIRLFETPQDESGSFGYLVMWSIKQPDGSWKREFDRDWMYS